MEIKTLELDLAGRTLKLETGLLAPQASGSIVISLGDTVILATAVVSDKPREDSDFLPLMVDYEEKFYATGKIKGSRFIKREGRPSDNAILTSRLIDRPIRPLFPKGMVNDVQVICTVLSADMEVDPATAAIIGASAALHISGAPFNEPVGAVRIGLIKDSKGEERLVVNPTYKQCEEGKLNIVVAGTEEVITMVEAAAKEVPEDTILEALKLAHSHIQKICTLQKSFHKLITQKELPYEMKKLDKEIIESTKSLITNEEIDKIQGETKKEVKQKIDALEERLLKHFEEKIADSEIAEKDLKEALQEIVEKRMRENILTKGIRLDGRNIDEIRHVRCMVGLLPRTHGSALFQRGETQALTVTTLGAPGAAQIVDTMDEDTVKRYMHHYNFPPFSTGEARPLRGTSRREIGHGDLAERALLPVLPDKDSFAYTMRLVSEITSCNGSSSMASVCGSTLSLMDAGVPIKKPVAGIAMGLITDDKGNYKILSDIQGMEDFAGDMDFKVAGTLDGITALQMDIKVSGLSIKVMKEALLQAKKGREFILEKMLEVLPEPRKELSPYAPLLITYLIDKNQIREVIGKGGETIQKIIEETGVEIDIEDDGLITITAQDQKSGEKALKIIKQITYVPQVGDVFDAKVTRILEFGAFAEFMPGKEGLIHISELAPTRVNRVEDVVKVGDIIKVKLIKIDEQGRYNLSHKAMLRGSAPR